MEMTVRAPGAMRMTSAGSATGWICGRFVTVYRTELQATSKAEAVGRCGKVQLGSGAPVAHVEAPIGACAER
jgi:hypothetical protein